jgi:hypothetical protein
MSVLNPTPPDRLVDGHGRPYFLWDVETTLDEFRAMLAGGDREVRAYLIAKLMRQAKPDDVFQFVTLEDIRRAWPLVERHLGRSRAFWTWILGAWRGNTQDAA